MRTRIPLAKILLVRDDVSSIFLTHPLPCLGTNCSVKIHCPISGLQQHNAVVLGVESTDRDASSSVQIRVLFCQPTRVDFKPCPHFLNDTCRFGDSCRYDERATYASLLLIAHSRYSHGFVVSIDDLLEYVEPNYE